MRQTDTLSLTHTATRSQQHMRTHARTNGGAHHTIFIMYPNRPSSARLAAASVARRSSGRTLMPNPDRSIPLMDGMVMDTIESMQDMGDLYTKKIEVERRRCAELENKLKVRGWRRGTGRLATCPVSCVLNGEMAVVVATW